MASTNISMKLLVDTKHMLSLSTSLPTALLPCERPGGAASSRRRPSGPALSGRPVAKWRGAAACGGWRDSKRAAGSARAAGAARLRAARLRAAWNGRPGRRGGLRGSKRAAGGGAGSRGRRGGGRRNGSDRPGGSGYRVPLQPDARHRLPIRL